MKKEELFAMAKEAIFGKPPEEGEKLIGYNVAVSYFGILVKPAETALLDLGMMEPGLPTYLKNAFEFSSYEPLRHFSPEARNMIKQCASNFKERYEPLLEKPEFKAA